MLTIFPWGGLCNRLYALHSAIRLSADIDQPLRVVWYANSDLGCELERLLEVPHEVCRLQNFSRINQTRYGKFRENLARTMSWPPIRPNFRQDDVVALMERGFDFTSWAARRHTQLRTLSQFYDSDGPFYPFRPVRALKSRIDDVTAGFSHTVGVHIRRTDHRPSIAFSPTALFEAAMQEVLDETPSATFFLATDEPGEEARLRTRFPGRIICAPKRSLDRATPEAIEDAVVDLYSLAATRRIIGSYASSFSRTAGLLGGIDFAPVKSEENPQLVW